MEESPIGCGILLICLSFVIQAMSLKELLVVGSILLIYFVIHDD